MCSVLTSPWPVAATSALDISAPIDPPAFAKPIPRAGVPPGRPGCVTLSQWGVMCSGLSAGLHDPPGGLVPPTPAAAALPPPTAAPALPSRSRREAPVPAQGPYSRSAGAPWEIRAVGAVVGAPPAARAPSGSAEVVVAPCLPAPAPTPAAGTPARRSAATRSRVFPGVPRAPAPGLLLGAARRAPLRPGPAPAPLRRRVGSRLHPGSASAVWASLRWCGAARWTPRYPCVTPGISPATRSFRPRAGLAAAGLVTSRWRVACRATGHCGACRRPPRPRAG
jgi:hypothetical protein